MAAGLAAWRQEVGDRQKSGLEDRQKRTGTGGGLELAGTGGGLERAGTSDGQGASSQAWVTREMAALRDPQGLGTSRHPRGLRGFKPNLAEGESWVPGLDWSRRWGPDWKLLWKKGLRWNVRLCLVVLPQRLNKVKRYFLSFEMQDLKVKVTSELCIDWRLASLSPLTSHKQTHQLRL